MDLKPGAILEGDFWAEPVRVLTLERIGSRMKIKAVGTTTQRYYSNVLGGEDLARVTVTTETGRDFRGRGEAYFLAMEAQRIRYAYQFDPLLAVNVSQVDPLPHQIEAVYHYILRNPRIRFLLADDPGAGKTMRKVREAVLDGLATRHIDLQRVPGEDRHACENRPVPEYIERFFEHSCRFMDIPLERRRDDNPAAKFRPEEVVGIVRYVVKD